MKQILAAAVVGVLVAAGLAAGILPAAANGVAGPAGSTADARAAAPTISVPRTAAAGVPFRVVVRAQGQAGTIALQRKAVGQAWRTVARKAARSGHGTGFRRTEAHRGRYAYRARLGGRHSRSGWIRVRASAPHLAVGVSADTADVFVDQTYTVSAELLRGELGLAGRRVRLERQAPGSSRWTTVGTFTTDHDGAVRTRDSSARRGPVYYRATSGTLSAVTMVLVWEVLDMPGPAGGLVVRKRGCGAAAHATDSRARLLLRSRQATRTRPACRVRTGDFVQVRWDLPGCTTVRFDNFVLDGSDGVRVRLAVTVDGQPLLDVGLARLERTGRFVVDGDPMNRIVVRMQVTRGSGGDFTGFLSEPEAVCNGLAG